MFTLTNWFLHRLQGGFNHLMLELAGVAAAHWHHAAIHVKFSHDGHAPFQLWTKRLRRAAAQAKQADQDVLFRILVGQEGLPAAIGHIIPPHQLHLIMQVRHLVQTLKAELLPPPSSFCYLVRSDFVVDFLDSHLSGPHILTLHKEEIHFLFI